MICISIRFLHLIGLPVDAPDGAYLPVALAAGIYLSNLTNFVEQHQESRPPRSDRGRG
jgi:hypothetical protein